jgi:putative FmdB family regulatory protein
MPIYEYRCRRCDHEFEAIQKVTDDPLRECPSCGEAALAKLVSAAGFRLKGAGWYETDFKGGSEKKRNLVGESGEPKAADGKASTQKSEAKTETPASAASREKTPGTAS